MRPPILELNGITLSGSNYFIVGLRNIGANDVFTSLPSLITDATVMRSREDLNCNVPNFVVTAWRYLFRETGSQQVVFEPCMRFRVKFTGPARGRKIWLYTESRPGNLIGFILSSHFNQRAG